MYDIESATYYYGLRNYDPSNGTWTKLDTYRGEYNDPESRNRYAFVANDPVNEIDEYGYTISDVFKTLNNAASNFSNALKQAAGREIKEAMEKFKRYATAGYTYVRTYVKTKNIKKASSAAHLVMTNNQQYRKVYASIQNGLKEMAKKDEIDKKIAAELISRKYDIGNCNNLESIECKGYLDNIGTKELALSMTFEKGEELRPECITKEENCKPTLYTKTTVDKETGKVYFDYWAYYKDNPYSRGYPGFLNQSHPDDLEHYVIEAEIINGKLVGKKIIVSNHAKIGKGSYRVKKAYKGPYDYKEGMKIYVAKDSHAQHIKKDGIDFDLAGSSRGKTIKMGLKFSGVGGNLIANNSTDTWEGEGGTIRPNRFNFVSIESLQIEKNGKRSLKNNSTIRDNLKDRKGPVLPDERVDYRDPADLF